MIAAGTSRLATIFAVAGFAVARQKRINVESQRVGQSARLLFLSNRQVLHRNFAGFLDPFRTGVIDFDEGASRNLSALGIDHLNL